MNYSISTTFDLYGVLAKVGNGYTVKVGAISSSDFDDAATIHEVRVDSNKQEVILYANVILSQVNSELEVARAMLIQQYVAAVKCLETEIERLKESINKEKDACAEKELEVERAWREAHVLGGQYGVAREAMDQLKGQVQTLTMDRKRLCEHLSCAKQAEGELRTEVESLKKSRAYWSDNYFRVVNANIGKESE